MKVHLMYRDCDFDLQSQLPSHEQELTQDLELNIMFHAMSRGDEFLFEVAKKAFFNGSSEPETILYRQDVLKDCLKNQALVRDLYDAVVELIENRKRRYYSFFSRYPGSILHSAIEMMQLFMTLLKKLKRIAEDHSDTFESDGFTTFFAMIRKDLDDEYLSGIQAHLKDLKFNDGVLISAELGEGNEGTRYVLRKPHRENQRWVSRIFSRKYPVYSFVIHPRDEGGNRALSELRDRGINLVANELAQSADHIDNFIKMLRVELGFYIGCLNLYEQLGTTHSAVSFPLPAPLGERRHSFRGLYDVCLALILKQKIVGNDMMADNKDIVIISGANQGGKSTFLRGIGLAQLMMQCGMFVPAESYCSNVCDNVFTHYKREEDISMKSGKLDEELGRMSAIADGMTSDSMVLFNESFAATNEREGSEIAKQIVSALSEKGIKIFFVTHLYEFPCGFYDKDTNSTLFLRAERQTDGKRTFRLTESAPLQTSYGEDLYKRIFEADKYPSGN